MYIETERTIYSMSSEANEARTNLRELESILELIDRAIRTWPKELDATKAQLQNTKQQFETIRSLWESIRARAQAQENRIDRAGFKRVREEAVRVLGVLRPDEARDLNASGAFGSLRATYKAGKKRGAPAGGCITLRTLLRRMRRLYLKQTGRAPPRGAIFRPGAPGYIPWKRRGTNVASMTTSEPSNLPLSEAKVKREEDFVEPYRSAPLRSLPSILKQTASIATQLNATPVHQPPGPAADARLHRRAQPQDAY